ncbi:MAG: nucleoside kinase [Vulcanimicrobiota bacterium]
MSQDMITVKLLEKEFQIPKATSILQFIEDSGIKTSYPVYGAKVNNELMGLGETLEEDATIVLIDGTSEDGRKIYRRSLCLVMIRAFKELFPEGKVMVFHSLSGGYYCRPALWRLFTKKDMKALRARMEEIIARDEPLLRQILTRDEALNLFEENGQYDKVKLLQYNKSPVFEVYRSGDLTDSLFGRMVPSTGCLKIFEILYYPPGFILRFPRSNNPLQLSAYSEQHKLFRVYYEYKDWVTLMGVSDVCSLNEVISSGETNDLIRVAEALHEKKIAAIADLVAKNKEQLRMILIAGPSSSGKTTFAQRLAVQLRVNGIKPVAISLDNYFLNREQTPRDEKGDYNFEILEALDLELFNETMHKLLAGEEVTIPRFDFAIGQRLEGGSRLKIRRDQPVIVEGIHCLNEKLTEYIARELKFKIYVSALTQLNLDDHNRISTTDTRVLRRIVRDRQFRGRDALGTLRRWDSVRRGEREHIFPYQEDSDVMFNSALVYELSVLKNFVEEPLLAIDRNEPEYSEAQRLLFTLQFFSKIGTDEIPPNSILREFIGATCFIRADVP